MLIRALSKERATALDFHLMRAHAYIDSQQCYRCSVWDIFAGTHSLKAAMYRPACRMSHTGVLSATAVA